MLVVASDTQMRVLADHAGGGHQIAIKQLQQRGLAGSVGSHQGETCVQIDTELQILVDPRCFIVVPEVNVLWQAGSIVSYHYL